MKKTRLALSYQRGSWKPGSKHQKHMGMNPTLFLYRFPGPRGPGPYTMKYWWTLGTFPTGLEVPFRLNEFLATYQQEHVPEEVEEWLGCFIKDPVEALEDGVNQMLNVLEDFAPIEAPRSYSKSGSTVPKKLLAPLKVMEEQLGVRIPPLGVRAAMNSPQLREKLLDDLYDYKEILSEIGSTPHRRNAKETFEQLPFDEGALPEPLALSSSSSQEGNAEMKEEKNLVELSPALEKIVGTVVSPPSSTAKDEKKLIELLTTVAEGCVLKDQPEEAYSVLSSSLSFAHDDLTRSVSHANVATAALYSGKFKEAEFHARESALLGSAPKRCPAGKRGYGLWATAVAYQEDFERAERIVDEAIEVYKEADNEVAPAGEKEDLSGLYALKEKVNGFKASNRVKDDTLRGSRRPLHRQRANGLLYGSGKTFDNEFDWSVFKGKLYPAKMNVTTNEMGSVFRRVGDLGGAISTSRSMEPL